MQGGDFTQERHACMRVSKPIDQNFNLTHLHLQALDFLITALTECKSLQLYS